MTDHNRVWSTESRLQFIEFKLYWEGRINRGDLISYFGISIPQASIDLKRYMEVAPDNLEYDKQRKAYFATDSFQPKLTKPSSRDYLVQLEMLKAEQELSFSQQSFISSPPDFDVVPFPNRVIEPALLHKVIKAIRERKAIYIRYQSMNRPEPTDRWITPHAIGSDGFRWHIRAYCHERNQFIDFVFGRILELSDTKESDINPANDKEWNTMIELTIAPYQGLDVGKKVGIEADYGMQDGIVKLVVRKALAGYLKKTLGFINDIADETSKANQVVASDKQQISLVSEVELPLISMK